MTQPRIEKLTSLKGTKFRRANVAEAITYYFGDDEVDSASYIRAGRVLRDGVERGVIQKIGAARYAFTGMSVEPAKQGEGQ